MSGKLSLRMKLNAGELARVDAAVAEFARKEEWPPELEFQIKLVLEELGLNIINHGHDGAEGREIEIEIVSEADAVTVEIVDDGRPFDPMTEAPAPDTESALEDRPVGGLGVHLVRTMMDEARYRREGDRNRLTLVKRRGE